MQVLEASVVNTNSLVKSGKLKVTEFMRIAFNFLNASSASGVHSMGLLSFFLSDADFPFRAKRGAINFE